MTTKILRELSTTRADKLINDAVLYKSDLQEISNYIYPVGDVNNSNTSGTDTEKSRRRKIHHNIGERSVEDLAGYIQNTLAPQGMNWLMLLPDDPKLMELDRINDWLDTAARRTQTYLARPEVKFHLMLDEVLIEAIACGTAVPHLLERNNPKTKKKMLVFKSVSITECCFEENTYGDIDRGFRIRQMTARQILQEYVADKALATHDLEAEEIKWLEDEAQANPTKKIEVLQGFFPPDDPIYVASGTKEPYASVHMFRDGGTGSTDRHQGILRNAGYTICPYVPFRFRKRAGETYGFGPGSRVLSDIISLQRMKKSNLGCAELMQKPPLHVPFQAYTKQLNIAPGAANHSKRTGSNKENMAQPLFVIGNVPIGVEMEDRTVAEIKSGMYLDKTQDQKNAEMSATESSIRERQNQQSLAPQTYRITAECFNIILEITIEYLIKRGTIDKMPDELRESGISPMYISQLIRAQADTDLIGLERLSGILANLSGAFPDLKDAIEDTNIPKLIVQRLFLPRYILKNPEAVKQAREQSKAISQSGDLAATAKDASQASLNLSKTADMLGV